MPDRPAGIAAGAQFVVLGLEGDGAAAAFLFGGGLLAARLAAGRAEHDGGGEGDDGQAADKGHGDSAKG